MWRWSSSRHLLIAAGPLVAGCLSSGEEPWPEPSSDSVEPSEAAERAPCTYREQVAADAFYRIYDPGLGESAPWYINDHTIVRGEDELWHLFGITHPEPPDPAGEDMFGHATASSLTSTEWTTLPPALLTDETYDETLLWAPHVIRHDGTYYMFYCGGGPLGEAAQIRLATSDDLHTWVRRPEALFADGFGARDPMVLEIDGQWVMYYTATSEPTGGNHIVAYRTSDDLLSWSERQVAFVDPTMGTSGGPTESPFVIELGGEYYLFIGPRPDYVGTDVFRSADPFHFELEARVGHIASHAAEVVRDIDGELYVTSSGWGEGGLYLAALHWCDPEAAAE